MSLRKRLRLLPQVSKRREALKRLKSAQEEVEKQLESSLCSIEQQAQELGTAHAKIAELEALLDQEGLRNDVLAQKVDFLEKKSIFTESEKSKLQERVSALEGELEYSVQQLDDLQSELTLKYENQVIELLQRPTQAELDAKDRLIAERDKRLTLLLDIFKNREKLPKDFPWEQLEATWSEMRAHSLRQSSDRYKAQVQASEKREATLGAEITKLQHDNADLQRKLTNAQRVEMLLEEERRKHDETRKRWRADAKRLREQAPFRVCDSDE